MYPNKRKLTPDEVRIARELYEEGKALKARYEANHSLGALAEKFDVGRETMRAIVNYTTYKDVK